MSERSDADLTTLQQRMEEVFTSLRANGNTRRKPVALTLRLDQGRYERLSAHAAQYMPRRSFQEILVAALDVYLGE